MSYQSWVENVAVELLPYLHIRKIEYGAQIHRLDDGVTEHGDTPLGHSDVGLYGK